jgi:hypothetical protein
MKNIQVSILFILIINTIAIFSQVKYAELKEKIVMSSITYSRVNPYENVGVQIGYTREGRIALGILFSTSTTHSPNKSAGIFIEGALLKPSSDDIIGIDLGVAGVKSFATDYSGYIKSITGVIGTLELFIPSTSTPVSPFIQLSGASAKSIFITALAFGADISIGDRNKPSIILTPGLAFSSESPLMAEVDLAIIISRSKK